MDAAGIDGYRLGWVAVVLRDGQFETTLTGRSLGDLLPRLANMTVAIDIPIGLPDEGEREADRLARDRVGRLRSSVFSAPPRQVVLTASTHEEANEIARARGWKGISQQAFALRGRILEAGEALRQGHRLYEVHPEVSFAAMAGRPLDWPKRSYRGAVMRRRLLEREGISLPDDLGEANEAPAEDVLDAAAAAWSAARIVRGAHIRLPDPPEVFSDGLPAAIHV